MTIDNRIIQEVKKRNNLLSFTSDTWEKASQFDMVEHSDDEIIEPLKQIRQACEALEKYLMKNRPKITEL
jgi:hypothetical protein